MRQTKIIATVGPASDSDDLLDALIAAGTDIVRLNFSHGTHQSHAATFARVRAAAERARREVAILQDLGGPKIRTGLLEGGRPIRLEVGDALHVITGEELGRAGIISTSFEGLARGVHPGDHLLLSDGTIELQVIESDGSTIRTTVVEGGMLGEHKGINAPGVALPTSAITLKDMDDLQFGLSLGVDLVALSFVQSADDMRRARQIVRENDGDVPLIAKIERPQALENLDEILACSDMVMIARGDLGLEMPLQRVPLARLSWRQTLYALGFSSIFCANIVVGNSSLRHASVALVQVPKCNVTFLGDQLVSYRRADIAVAVSIPGGLITPIVKDAANKSVSAIATEMKDLAQRAKDGKLKPEEYQGGTASISNMGMFGIKAFDAVINPPQGMILAVGAGEKRPYIVDDALGIATVMSVTGSFDHRAIDGADGAQLMQALKALVESPLGMVA